MARPQKDTPPTKERFIHVRVTNDLYDVIAKEAKEAYLSVSEYLGKLATDKRITLRKEVVFDNLELLSALSNLGKIGSNLNQIARYLNMQGIDTNWRDVLGYEEDDRYNRKRLGDFACYIVFY